MEEEEGEEEEEEEEEEECEGEEEAADDFDFSKALPRETRRANPLVQTAVDIQNYLHTARGESAKALDMGSTDEGVPDGMTVDAAGNVLCTGPGGIWVCRANGEFLGRIILPEIPSNLAWGDDDGKTIYTTGGTMVTRIRVKVAGFRP